MIIKTTENLWNFFSIRCDISKGLKAMDFIYICSELKYIKKFDIFAQMIQRIKDVFLRSFSFYWTVIYKTAITF